MGIERTTLFAMIPAEGRIDPRRGVPMAGDNLVLYVATYNDPAAAAADYKTLKDAESSDELAIEGSVVVTRDADGKVAVKETGGGQIGGGALIGGSVGAIVGVFAPPFLLATAIGAGIGAIAGELTKKHEEKKLGVDLDEYLPEGSSAILVVLHDQYLDGVEGALTKADKQVNKAIDSGDYDQLQKALSKADTEVDDAVDS
jgi:uncharacterized membrane protein